MTGCKGKPDDVRDADCERVRACDADCDRDPVCEGDFDGVGVPDCVCVRVTEGVVDWDCERVPEDVWEGVGAWLYDDVVVGVLLGVLLELPDKLPLGVADELRVADVLREADAEGV